MLHIFHGAGKHGTHQIRNLEHKARLFASSSLFFGDRSDRVANADGFSKEALIRGQCTEKTPLTRRTSERLWRAAGDKWRLPELYSPP
jgi:hypothetical protein